MQQSVHLAAGAHVGAYLLDDALLCTGELEGQPVVVEGVEDVADVGEDVAAVLPALVAGVAQDVKLHVEQLLELQSEACVAGFVGRLRVVDVAQGGVSRDESQGVDDVGREGLGQGLGDAVEGCAHDALDGARGDAGLFHLLGGHVVGLHAHGGELHLVGLVDLGVGKLVASVVDGGFAEDDVGGVDFVADVVFCGDEPDDVGDARAVGDVGDDALLAWAHLVLLVGEDAGAYLHVRHVVGELGDGVDVGSVDVFIGIVLQQVTEGFDAQFFAEELASAGSYAWDVFHVLFEYAHFVEMRVESL